MGLGAGQRGEIPDPERGDDVEGEAFAETVGGLEMAILDARSLFQGLTETFNPPPDRSLSFTSP